MANAPPPDAFQLTLMKLCRCRQRPRRAKRKTTTHPRRRDEIRVPSAIRELDIVEAQFALCRLPVDVSGDDQRPSQRASTTSSPIFRRTNES